MENLRIQYIKNDFDIIKKLSEPNITDEEKNESINKLKILSKYNIKYYQENIGYFDEIVQDEWFITLANKLEKEENVLDYSKYLSDNNDKKEFYDEIANLTIKYSYLIPYYHTLHISDRTYEVVKKDNRLCKFKYFIVQGIINVINTKSTKVCFGIPVDLTQKNIETFFLSMIEKEIITLEFSSDSFTINWTDKNKLLDHLINSTYMESRCVI